MTTKSLYNQSLKGKWDEDSDSRIFTDCAFCEEARERLENSYADPCDICLCHPLLCSMNGHNGLIRNVHQQWKFVNDIPSCLLTFIRKCLKELADTEVLSPETTKKITNVIDILTHEHPGVELLEACK